MAEDKKTVLDIVKELGLWEKEYEKSDKIYGRKHVPLRTKVDRGEWMKGTRSKILSEAHQAPKKTTSEEVSEFMTNWRNLEKDEKGNEVYHEGTWEHANKYTLPKGGTYVGEVYYSDILPKKKLNTIPWTKEASNIVRAAARYNATREDVFKAQEYFASIGYMHPSEIDGWKGKQLMGMIRRWGLGPGVSKEASWDAMEIEKDRLFD